MSSYIDISTTPGTTGGDVRQALAEAGQRITLRFAFNGGERDEVVLIEKHSEMGDGRLGRLRGRLIDAGYRITGGMFNPETGRGFALVA